MNILLIVLIIVFIGGFIGLVVFLNKRFGAGKGDQSFLLIQNQINELNKTIDNKLGQSNQILQQQFSQSAQIIREVTEHLTKLDETNKQVINFTEQLQSLQDILKNPKQRGILGEYYLETLLKNILPPDTYKMQYKFLDGEIVDAVVFVGNKIIPVDSKFSLENYNRIIEEKNQAEKDKLEKQFVSDLKQRVTETAKYIRPNENTMDFAFMFIPHEAIYYDLLINKIGSITGDTESIIQRAAGKYHVIIVSPTSFLAYLQTVLQGLRALKIEESIKEIIKNIGDVSKHLLSYEEYMKKLGNNLGTTVGMYNQAYKEFKKIDKDITRIAGGKSGVDPLELEKPSND
ncbi:MAG: DNA recombination protein RmuC [Patescibacteria group bacterium]|jgi:DNA recombination protein RmuC